MSTQQPLFIPKARRTASGEEITTDYVPYTKHSKTSRAAAEKKRRAGTAGTDREKVLAFIKECGAAGATDNEIIAEMEKRHPAMSANSPRARRVGLVTQGLVRDSGRMRNGCTVWEVVP